MSTLKHLRSSTADKRPAASGMADGQIAINTASGTPGLYIRDTASGIVKVGPAHVGTTAPNATPAGSAGNSRGEFWIDEATTTPGLKYWNGSAFANLTPSGTTTTVGLVELATNAETQAGSDALRAITPAGLQSKVSDSISTTSSTTIASATAVKTAYDLANAALPRAGGTVTGELLISPSGSLVFEGSSDDSFETTFEVVNPTADRTITFPDVTGTVITSADTGTVTSAMIANGAITNDDINASAAIALSKLATGALPTAITVASANIVDGTIVDADVNASAAIAGTKISPNFGAQNVVTTGTSTAASFIPTSSTVPTNGVYLPAANSVAISTNGTGRLFVDASGNVGVGVSPTARLESSQNIGFGTGGTFAAGQLYSDTNWGVILRAKQASPGVAEFAFQNAGGTERIRVTGTGSFNIKGAGDGNTTQAVSFNGSAPVNSLVLDSLGRLGLGTSSPAAGLHISTAGQTTSAIDTTGSLNLLVTDTGFAGGNGGSLIFGASAGAYRFASIKGFLTDGSNNSQGDIAFSTRNATTDAALTERLRITAAGRVGIGTASPQALCHLRSDADGAVTHLYLQNRNAGANAQSRIAFTDSANDLADSRHAYIGTVSTGAGQNGNSFVIATNPNGGSAQERVWVSSTGNVGIGTTSPVTLLQAAQVSTGTVATFNYTSSTGGGSEIRVSNGYSSTAPIYSFWFNNTTGIGNPAANEISAIIAGTERARIDSSGRLLVGTSSSVWDASVEVARVGGSQFVGHRYGANAFPSEFSFLKSRGASIGTNTIVNDADTIGQISFRGADGSSYIPGASISASVDGTPGTNDMPGRLVFSTTADGASSPTERMRITNGGLIVIGNTTATGIDVTSASATGTQFEQNGAAIHVRSAQTALFVGRQTDDGNLVGFYQAGVSEGSISVSGTTVSYNGAHLSRWSQLPGGTERTEILRGTVLSNIDEMCAWGEEDNEQLNRMKVSDVEGDPNVAGVFQGWDDDDDTYTDDFYCAMTGDFIIRIAEGTMVQRGDLLMSAGDGTAKPQGDDIIRSKTVAKVTSTHVSCTYEDGSYCVPCVLMAC